MRAHVPAASSSPRPWLGLFRGLRTLWTGPGHTFDPTPPPARRAGVAGVPGVGGRAGRRVPRGRGAHCAALRRDHARAADQPAVQRRAAQHQAADPVRIRRHRDRRRRRVRGLPAARAADAAERAGAAGAPARTPCSAEEQPPARFPLRCSGLPRRTAWTACSAAACRCAQDPLLSCLRSACAAERHGMRRRGCQPGAVSVCVDEAAHGPHQGC